MERPLALVVDKDPAIREAICKTFESHGVSVLTAGSENEAHDVLKNRSIGFLILDLDAPGIEALAPARRALAIVPPPIVIGLGASGSNAIDDLLALGAFDVLPKPFQAMDLRLLVRRALREQAQRGELRRLEHELQSREGYDGVVGRSEALARVRAQVSALAGSTAAVWFSGEPGTGKELAARTLHAQSGAEPGTFVLVACASLEAGDWEARWLGPKGWVEQARSGAIYLQGLPQLALELQERLVQVLARSRSDRSAVRWLASSLAAPDEEVNQGRLLDELRRALGRDVVSLPALRQRAEDVPVLASHFLTQIREINRLPPIRFAAEALALLGQYRWPGNVQELRHAVEQAVILATEGTIRAEHLPEAIRRGGAPGAAPAGAGLSTRQFRAAKRDVVEAFEQTYLRELMQRHTGNVTAASQHAGMLRSALQRLLRKYTLRSSEFRKPRRVRTVEEATRSAGGD